MRRSALLLASVLVAALAAPAGASAALGDDVLPVVTRGDGIFFVPRSSGALEVRFGPAARERYRRELAGRAVQVTCTEVRVGGPGRLFRQDRSTSETLRAPRRMRRLTADAEAIAADADLCTLATRAGAHDDQDGTRCEDGWCVLAIAPLTADGRARVEELQRTLDLSLALLALVLATEGDTWPTLAEVARELDVERVGAPDDRAAEWTVLQTADAGPLVPGPVGFFIDGRTLVLSARTLAGRRLFVRFDGDVFSTNVPDLIDP